VGEKLLVALRITESPAKLCVVVRDEVFRVLVWVGGGGRGVLGPFLSLSWWGGGELGAGAEVWGRALGEGGVQGLSHDVTGP